MALVVRHTKRVAHQTEPDTWFELRVPLSVGDLASVGDVASQAEAKIATVTLALKAWSYPEPLTPENVRELDGLTFNWLLEQVFDQSALDDETKNASGASSSPITEQAEAPSQPSSDT